MDKKDLANILNEIFIPAGYKKKGDYWVLNGDEINKMVNLQKSQFSETFYINYGYILKSLPLNNLKMHVFNGLSSMYENEQVKLNALLNLGNDFSDIERAADLKDILGRLLEKVNKVNSEADVYNELKSRDQISDVPIIVKDHFKLNEF